MVPSKGTRARAKASSKPVSFEQIERAAVRLFSEKTYAAVGMRDISDAVGILAGSLYTHIANKEDLLLGIVRRGIQNYVEALAPISVADLPAPERLRLIMRRYMELLHTTPEQTRVSFNQWTYLGEENQRIIAKLREEYEAVFFSVISEGIAANEFPSIKHPRITVLATMGLLNSAIQWYSGEGSLDAAQIGDDLADLALEGLCAGSGTPA